MIFKELGLEVPRTYGEFLEVCRVLKQNGTAPLAAGGNPTETGKYWLNYFFQVDLAKADPDWQRKRNEGLVSFRMKCQEHAGRLSGYDERGIYAGGLRKYE